ncbi:PepSY domain-containing protein [Nitrospira sp. M1]
MSVIRLLHRWIGIVLCLMFSAWFISGAVLMYHPFPSLSPTERQMHRSTIDFSSIVQSPKAALNVSGVRKPTRLRIIDRDGSPTYVVHSGERSVIPIDADDGEIVRSMTGEMAGRIASAFYDHAVLKVEGPLDYDQWIVHQRFDPYRPFFRVIFHDQPGTVLYVSARTGEVLQKTQRYERAWNYVGAVVHWIYPTILRRHWALWDQVVWWIAFFGILTTIAGLWLGVKRLRQVKKSSYAHGFSPFHGWLRYHHVLGLGVGVLVLTWIGSGWISMDHGRIFSSPIPTPKQIEAFQGISLNDATTVFTTKSLRNLSHVKELEFLAVAGKPLVLIKEKQGLQLYEVLNSQRLATITLKRDEIVRAIQRGWPGSSVRTVQIPQKDDLYGQLRASVLPHGTLRFELDDSSQTWIHINMVTGEIVSIMDLGRRIYRWLFNGLHSLDFPGLVDYRPLWDIVMLILLSVGFMFSATGVVIGWRRVFE